MGPRVKTCSAGAGLPGTLPHTKDPPASFSSSADTGPAKPKLCNVLGHPCFKQLLECISGF